MATCICGAGIPKTNGHRKPSLCPACRKERERLLQRARDSRRRKKWFDGYQARLNRPVRRRRRHKSTAKLENVGMDYLQLRTPWLLRALPVAVPLPQEISEVV